MHQTTTATATHPLADRWVAMARDGGRPPHLGVLTRVRPWTAPDGRTWWSWVLRTHTGHLVGSSPLADTVALTRADRALIGRARGAMTRRKRWLESIVDPGTGIVPRAVAAGLADIAHDRALLGDLPDEERP